MQDLLSEGYTNRGKSYQKLQKFEEAVKDFSMLIDNALRISKNRKSVAE